MQRNVIVTKDGSHSIEIPELHVSYHSVHGAIQESLHVFIEAGLKHWLSGHASNTECTIFEMGFGTGLNALLTFMETAPVPQKIVYKAVEAYPLESTIAEQLNYCEALQRPDLQRAFRLLHQCEWNKPVPVGDHFTLNKVNTTLEKFSSDRPIDLIYYDAFAPNAQPELWTETVFQQLFNMLTPGGILVTYCSKGTVRRALQAVGFTVEKLAGPRGKREMIRAYANE
jgi:tRNA U34 5-methylaminomethyl-2-thiouridine-forming methyltransferase MnmC